MLTDFQVVGRIADPIDNPCVILRNISHFASNSAAGHFSRQVRKKIKIKRTLIFSFGQTLL